MKRFYGSKSISIVIPKSAESFGSFPFATCRMLSAFVIEDRSNSIEPCYGLIKGRCVNLLQIPGLVINIEVSLFSQRNLITRSSRIT
jgi:hypothetical protein